LILTTPQRFNRSKDQSTKRVCHKRPLAKDRKGCNKQQQQQQQS